MQSPTIAFLVNGEPAGAMGIRARSFEQRLRGDFRIEIAYREGNKALAIWRFFLFLVRLRPALCYVFDMGFSGVIAASLYRPISRCRVVVDTGDAIYELARLTGRGRIGLWLTKLLEQLSFSISDRIVVRSHPHQELLDREGISADVIPDGVDTTEFFPCVENELRKQYGLDGVLVVGILGSLIWNSREQTCYGWELIELIHRLRDQPVKGVIIGDGSGLPKLKALCAAQNLEDRMVFLGRIPYSDLPGYLNMMDICLSTQTNDGAGQVRTTGKLPLYLACGRFVLSSQVGEAARLLPQEMLVPYDGTKDNEYPAKLEERVRWALQQREPVSPSARSVTLAQANFEYNVLAARLRKTLLDLLPVRPERPRQESLAARESDPVRAADRE
jgi:glycosyltransferase involved in cell wall biosynthesis